MTGNPSGPPARSSGIYALINRDGAPLDPADLQALGLIGDDSASWAIEAADSHFPGAVGRHADERGTTVIVGDIAERSDLAARLGLRCDAPPALVAREALNHFGGDTPREMIGEWSLIQIDCCGTMTLMQAATHRDRLFYAISGTRIAVASNLFALAGLAWVDSSIDETGLLGQFGGWAVRRARGDKSMLRGVKQLRAGDGLTISADGSIAEHHASALTEQPRWHGSFGDAVEATTAVLRTIMRERLASPAVPVVMLSGGLDSSLLAWLAAEARGPGQPLFAKTSAAPPESGIADELGFAAIVADHLQIPLEPIYPAPNIYRPTDATLAGVSGPPTSNRICLTEAFQAAATRSGANLLINGTYGELTATLRLGDLRSPFNLRRIIGDVRRAIPRPDRAIAAHDAFHVRVAPSRLAHLPEGIAAALHLQKGNSTAKPGGLLGYVDGAVKAIAQSTEFRPGAVRAAFPFRDIRLIRLFAGFPVKMLLEGGRDRAVARHMLRGRLPDAIRLRQSGLPASPAHLARLRQQAGAARDRIAAFRKAEVDEWLDLDWLDQRLGHVAAHGPTDVNEANAVQMTAIVAEFLTWWRERS